MVSDHIYCDCESFDIFSFTVFVNTIKFMGTLREFKLAYKYKFQYYDSGLTRERA